MATEEDIERIASETMIRLVADVATKTGYTPAATIALEYLGQHDHLTGAVTKRGARAALQGSKSVFVMKATVDLGDGAMQRACTEACCS